MYMLMIYTILMKGTFNFSSIKGFDWDSGNADKNWFSHRVTMFECEQIFFNKPLLVADDTQHSTHETRHYALGRTNENRLLFIAFAIKKDLLRIISTRDMSRKERKNYEQA